MLDYRFIWCNAVKQGRQVKELQKEVDGVIDEIGAAEGALQKAAKRSCKLVDQIYSIDAEIAESKMLLNRNNSLLSQYAADIKRLTNH